MKVTYVVPKSMPMTSVGALEGGLSFGSAFDWLALFLEVALQVLLAEGPEAEAVLDRLPLLAGLVLDPFASSVSGV